MHFEKLHFIMLCRCVATAQHVQSTLLLIMDKAPRLANDLFTLCEIRANTGLSYLPGTFCRITNHPNTWQLEMKMLYLAHSWSELRTGCHEVLKCVSGLPGVS